MTNAEFLNENFGTNYKAWMKCLWSYSFDLKVWLLAFDGEIRYGWKNIILGDKVFECYVGSDEVKLPTHKDFNENYRLVVDKAQNYKILGVYKYDKEKSDKNIQRIWIKVANSLDEFKLKYKV